MLLFAALALTSVAGPLSAQAAVVVARAPGTIGPEVTSSSAAKQAFTEGVEDAAYVFGSRAAQHFGRALALDSAYGLARVFYASFASQLEQGQRDSIAAQGVADAARGSTAELLLAAAIRELVANRPEIARPLFRALGEMYPDNALYAMWSATDWAGTREPAATVQAFRDVTERFPTYGATYNTLAYTLLQIGDTAAAVAAAAKQVEVAPTHPNVHDSYGELLQFVGRFDEAVTHYTHATERAPSFTEGYVGVAEVRQLQRRGADARVALNQAIRNAVNLPDSLRYMRYLAQSDVADGRDKQAARQLATVAQLAESRGLKAQAAAVHRDLALLAAMGKNTRGVNQHLAAARAAGASDTAAQATQHAGAAALAYLMVGNADSLRATAAGRDSAHLVQAAVLLQAGRAEEALRELAQTDTTALITQELSAEAHARLTHADVARAARQRLLARRDGVYFNAPDLRNVAALRHAANAKR
jgi:tetratricopeptide (TPR) repeat protein